MKRSASLSALSSSVETAPSSSWLRRPHSEAMPSAAPTSNPLALSLSMISAHVHDDEDGDGKEHDEW